MFTCSMSWLSVESRAGGFRHCPHSSRDYQSSGACLFYPLSNSHGLNVLETGSHQPPQKCHCSDIPAWASQRGRVTKMLKCDGCVKGTRADQRAPEQRMPSHEPLNKLLSLPTAPSPGHFFCTLQQTGSIWSPNTKLSPPSLRCLHRKCTLCSLCPAESTTAALSWGSGSLCTSGSKTHFPNWVSALPELCKL